MTNANPVATFIRRDEHPVQPVIYQFGQRLFRCSEREWFRMVQAKETAE